MELEPLPWPALRDTLAPFEWNANAIALIETAEPGIEPLLEDLHHAIGQVRRARVTNDAMRQLGRI